MRTQQEKEQIARSMRWSARGLVLSGVIFEFLFLFREKVLKLMGPFPNGLSEPIANLTLAISGLMGAVVIWMAYRYIDCSADDVKDEDSDEG